MADNKITQTERNTKPNAGLHNFDSLVTYRGNSRDEDGRIKITVSYDHTPSVMKKAFNYFSVRGYKPLPDYAINDIPLMLENIEQVINVKFVPVKGKADINFMQGDSVKDDFAGVTTGNRVSTSRNVVIDSETLKEYRNDSNDSRRMFFRNMYHEIGHALGLDHPFGGGKGRDSGGKNSDFDINGTMMSYNFNRSSKEQKIADPDSITAIGLRSYDMIALQQMYGAPKEWKDQYKDGRTFTAEDMARRHIPLNLNGGSHTIDLSDAKEIGNVDLRPNSHNNRITGRYEQRDSLGGFNTTLTEESFEHLDQIVFPKEKYSNRKILTDNEHDMEYRNVAAFKVVVDDKGRDTYSVGEMLDGKASDTVFVFGMHSNDNTIYNFNNPNRIDGNRIAVDDSVSDVKVEYNPDIQSQEGKAVGGFDLILHSKNPNQKDVIVRLPEYPANQVSGIPIGRYAPDAYNSVRSDRNLEVHRYVVSDEHIKIYEGRKQGVVNLASVNPDSVAKKEAIETPNLKVLPEVEVVSTAEMPVTAISKESVFEQALKALQATPNSQQAQSAYHKAVGALIEATGVDETPKHHYSKEEKQQWKVEVNKTLASPNLNFDDAKKSWHQMRADTLEALLGGKIKGKEAVREAITRLDSNFNGKVDGNEIIKAAQNIEMSTELRTMLDDQPKFFAEVKRIANDAAKMDVTNAEGQTMPVSPMSGINVKPEDAHTNKVK